MLAAVLPQTFIATTICPRVLAEAVLAILRVASVIFSAIWPCVDPMPIHIVIDPTSLINSAIDPLVAPLPINLIFKPIACVATAIRLIIFTSAMFASKLIYSIIFTAIYPYLNTIAML
jgi:hypothetical protein